MQSLFCALALAALFPLLGNAQRPDITREGDGTKLTTASSATSLSIAQNPAAGRTELRVQGTPSVPETASNNRRVISYQGILQQDGRPVVDGQYGVTIRLYGDSLASAKLWEGTYRVNTFGGVFNVELGSGDSPLPESSALDRDLWLSLQIGIQEELRPLSHLTASPYALNVADGSISASKISADYVRSISINGQAVTGNGVNVDIQTGDGIMAAVDPTTGSIVLKGTGENSGSAAGSGAQGNTTISGSLTVTGITQLYNSLSLGGNFSAGGHVTLGTDLTDSINFRGHAGSNLNMGGYALSNVGILGVDSLKLNRALSASNGGTGFSSYATGDLLYGNSSSTLSRLSIGSTGKMLTIENGLPSWSSVTYPASTSANQILFSSAANTVSGISTANSGVLVTDANGAPSIGSTLPNAVQDNITRIGTVTSFGSTVVPMANGGTGATTQAAALKNLTPDTSGQTGKVLTVKAGGGIGWTTVAGGGSGTVTSVDVSGGTTGLTTTGGAVTTSGTITLGGTLSAANGGTGQSSYTTGDMLYSSGATSMSKLPVGSTTKVLGSNGSTPTWTDNGATITNDISSPAALTGTTNNFSISVSQTYLRVSNGAGAVIDLTGISSSGVAAGRNITIFNTSSDPIRLKHHGSSAAGNQFDLPGGEDIILGQRGSATFIYDSAAGYWELKSTN